MPHGSAVLLTTSALLLAGCPRTQADTRLPQHYDDKEAALARLDDPKRDAWAMPDQVVAALGLEPTMRVADIGAGSGYFARRIAAAVPEGVVIAVDVDHDFKRFVEANRESWGTPNIEPHLAMYDHPMLKAASVDMVFVSNTYAYIRERTDYLRQLAKALRPGGVLVIIDFQADASCEGVADCPAKAQRVARERTVSDAESVGFELTGEESFLPHQYFLKFRRP